MDKLKLSQFPNVPATGVATLRLDELKGRGIYGLQFEYGGTAFTTAMITSVKISMGNKLILPDISGPNLQKLNSYEGDTTTAGYFNWYFGDRLARTIRGEYLGVLDLSVYKDIPVLEVTIAGATAPTLQVYALVTPPKAQLGLGYTASELLSVRALVRSVFTPAGAVNKQAYAVSLGSQAGSVMRKLQFFNANLSSVEYRKAGVVRFDNVADANNDDTQDDFGKSPQAGLYTLDFMPNGNVGEAEATTDSKGNAIPMQISVTTTAADTLTVYADIFAPLAFL
ncbi:MAG TPA: major capsid protein P2 [Gammaproteobacteria bacterium]|nr:major capsid protein P2 [Gammaproteobacteria bacterium]